jgi:hypothetical protein
MIDGETRRLLNSIWNKKQVGEFLKDVYAGMTGCKERIRLKPC